MGRSGTTPMIPTCRGHVRMTPRCAPAGTRGRRSQLAAHRQQSSHANRTCPPSRRGLRKTAAERRSWWPDGMVGRCCRRRAMSWWRRAYFRLRALGLKLRAQKTQRFDNDRNQTTTTRSESGQLQRTAAQPAVSRAKWVVLKFVHTGVLATAPERSNLNFCSRLRRAT